MRSDKELEKDQMKEKTEHMCKKMEKRRFTSVCGDRSPLVKW